MANDGSITFSVWLDADEAEKELSSIKKKILDLETELGSQQKVKSEMEERLRHIGAAADEAKAKLAELQRSGAPAAAIKEQQAVVTGLDKDFNTAAAALEKQNAKIAETNAKLEAQKNLYGEVQRQATAAGNAGAEANTETTRTARETGSAMEELSSRIEKVTSRIVGLVKRVFFFSLITKALRSVREYFSSALQTSDEFTAAVGRLKGALLTAFQPIFSAVLPAITAFINILTQVISLISTFTAMLFGTTVQASSAAAESLNEEADALKKVGGGGKEAAKQLANFDEINQLAESGGGGGGGAAGAMDATFEEMEIASPILQKFKQLLEDLDFTNLKESLGGLKESFSGLASTIGDGLGWAWDHILVPLAKWTIEKLAPKLVDALAAAFDFLKAVLEALAPILEPLWENVLKPLFAAVGDIIITGLEELTDLLKDLTDLINGDITFEEFINGLDGLQLAVVLLGGAFLTYKLASWIIGIGQAVLGLPGNLAGAINGLNGFSKAVALAGLAAADAVLVAYDVKKLDEAAKTYNDAHDAHNRETENALNNYAKLYEEKGKEVADQWALMVYNIDTTNMSFEEAQQEIAKTIESYWDDVPENMWEGFKAGWNYYFGENGAGLLALLRDAFLQAVEGIKQLLGIHSPSTVFSDIGEDLVQGLWNGFKAKWTEFTDWLTEKWEGIVEWWQTDIAPVFTADWWTNKLSSIGDGMKAAINGALAAVETGVNWIVDKLNLLSFDVPAWVPEIGGKHFGLNIPHISVPRLAAGAVIPPNREFLAVLGDQTSGTNIEAPLETMVAAFKQALSESNAGNRTLVLKVGEYEFAQLVFNTFSTESARVGFSSVT